MHVMQLQAICMFHLHTFLYWQSIVKELVFKNSIYEENQILMTKKTEMKKRIVCKLNLTDVSVSFTPI